MGPRIFPISKKPRIKKPSKQRLKNFVNKKKFQGDIKKKKKEENIKRRKALFKRRILAAAMRARVRLNPAKVNLTQSNFNKKTFKVKFFSNKNNVNGENKEINVNVPKRIAFPSNHLMVNMNKLPTQDWINDQVNYIKSLDAYDFETAMAFTVQSFFWITPYMYGTPISQIQIPTPPGFLVPLYPQISEILSRKNQSKLSQLEQIILGSYEEYVRYIHYIPPSLLKEALDMYIVDLKRIIRNAPPIPRTMVVYRGLDKNIFGVGGLMPNVRHTLRAFTSASYIPNKMYGDERYVKFVLPRGTRILLIQTMNHWANSNKRYTGEYEVLLNIGTKFVIEKREIRRPVINDKSKVTIKYVTEVKVYDWPAPSK